MIQFKALAFILVGLFNQNASASVGAIEQPMLEFASVSYLNGSLQLNKSQQRKVDCLAKVIWYEARGESNAGKTLVANVVRNRMDYGKPFASTICKVVYQRNQFAWTRNSSKKHISFKQIAKNAPISEQKAVQETLKIALKQLILEPKVETNATHFCSIGDKCNFKNVEKLGKVGNHTVFRYLGNA